MNRDYHARPYQATGRSAHDYGHTHLTVRPRSSGFGWYALAVLFFVVILGGCGPTQMPQDLESAYQRSDVVRVCADGSIVGRDPETGRYVVGKSAWDHTMRGWVAPGVRPEQVCATRP